MNLLRQEELLISCRIIIPLRVVFGQRVKIVVMPGIRLDYNNELEVRHLTSRY